MDDLTVDQITKAMRAYLGIYALPKLPKADNQHLLNGFLNDVGLPSDGNDFCVFTSSTTERNGTTIESFDPGGEAVKLNVYFTIAVQVDCYSTNRVTAQQRAQAYEAFARSSYGVQLFKSFGLDLQYADSLQNLTAVMDAGQYVSRWSLTLHFGLKKVLQVQEPSFDSVSVDIANVDVKFPPKE